MTMKQKMIAKTPIKNRVEVATNSLRRDLSRCEKSLRNKTLKPLSLAYYERRREMIEAELAKLS
jgi:hypothetical protein